MNPTVQEVKDMEKDVDPKETGSFDQISLISLIAKRPKQLEDLEQMMSALKTIANNPIDDEGSQNKIQLEMLKFSLLNNGEKLQEHEVEEIVADISDLINSEDCIMIDTFAKYLMQR